MKPRREPIDRLVDLAVAVPTCMLVAAKRAVPLAARVGTLGTARFVGRLSEAVHERRRDSAERVAGRAISEAMNAEPSDVDGQHVDVATVTADELPIEGYDDLAARQIVDRLGALDRPDLARVETYEREHRSRSTVLGKIAQLTA